jgi:hypothetical protein
MGSGFTGDWDGRRPPVHARPPDPPYTLDQLQASARILGAELGYGWAVKATDGPEGPRLEVRKSLSQDGPPVVVAATLKKARKRVAEYIRENQ